MPDLLTHALVMYVLLQGIALFDDRMSPPYIAAGMVGGLLPDVAKLQLLVPRHLVETLLGVPFSWQGLSWLWGMLLVALALSLLVEARHRCLVLGLLLAGGLIHTFLDSLIRSPGQRPTTLLRPTTYLQTPELYLSSDVWPAVVASVAALVVFTLSRQSGASPSG